MILIFFIHCETALPLAKKLKLKPQEIANKLMESLDVGDLVEEMNISGPGFINIKLSDTYLKSKITNMLTDSSGRLGIPGT
jgi:arginyl-tRNA synthetase